MKKYLLTIFLIIISLLTSISFASTKTLTFCAEGSPEGFDPALYTGTTTFDATRPVFNRLVEYQYGTTELKPALAQSWEISEDGKTITFKLRQNVSFHSNDDFTPSRPFNADDVIATFDRLRNKEGALYKATKGSFDIFYSMGIDKLIKDIKKIDDYTVTFVLTRPETSLTMDFVSFDFAAIQSKEYMDFLMKNHIFYKLNTAPIGTGRWIFQDYQKDSFIRYMANPNHYSGAPNIDYLIFNINNNASARWAKLQKGECDIMAVPNPSDLAQMEESDKVNLYKIPALNVSYLAFHTQKPPLDNIKVRKALAMAVNKKTIIDAIYQNAATIAKTPIPPSISWAYDDSPDEIYNPKAAKELLAEAGYSEGFTIDLWAMSVQRSYNPNARRMAEIIQADWEQISVHTNIKTYEWGEYLDRSKKGEHQAILLGWGGFSGDPYDSLYYLLSCDTVSSSNRARWCQKDFDHAIEQARQSFDIETRGQFYKKAQKIFKDETPWIPIAHSVISVPVSKKLKNFKADPFGRYIFPPQILSIEE